MPTIEALAAPIVAEFAALVKAVLELAEREPERPLADVLTDIRRGMLRVGRLLATAVVGLGEQRAAAPCCCGQRMWSKGPRPRDLVTSLGHLRLPARRYRCAVCGAERQPLWERNPLFGNITAEFWPQVRDLLAWMPYRVSERHLARQDVQLSDNTLQRRARLVGGGQADARRAEATAVQELRLEVRPQWRPEWLYQLMDGCFVRLRGGQGKFREVKVAVHFQTRAEGRDALGRPPQALAMAVTAAGCRGANTAGTEAREAAVEAFLPLVWLQAERCGARVAKKMILLADGAAWNWRRADEMVPLGTPKVEILDIWHAGDKLGETARAVFGEATDGKRELAEAHGYLERGQRRELADKLGGWRPRTDAAGVAAIDGLLGYYGKHWSRMNYLELASEGYHIGSGTVESWCKQMLHRLDGSGMFWSDEGLDAVLNLRCESLMEAWQPYLRKKAA